MKPTRLQNTLSKPAGGGKTPRILSRLGAVLLALALMLSVTVAAFAYTRIDTAAETSLTVSYVNGDGSGISGVSFPLYRVGDVTETVRISLSGDFAGAPVDIGGIDAAGGWIAAAATLSSYAAANGIAPTAEGVTDADGQIVFDGLTVGLYLLAGESVIVGDDLYTPVSSLILLPTLDDATDEWIYGPTAAVKYETETLQEYTGLTVQKVWDDGDYSGRPDSVTIQLVRDGAVIDTVALNADNGWKYTWTDLPLVSDLETGAAYTYTVNEASVPEGYTVAVTQSGYAYKVTNSRDTAEATPAPTSTPAGTTLPQTGQLNWPIPILVIAGLLLICAGLYFNRKGKNHGADK